MRAPLRIAVHWLMRRPALARGGRLACGGAAFATVGCVSIYHPMSGFQRPVAIDPSKKNFEGVRMRMTCYTSADLPNDAVALCNRARGILKRQGAEFTDEDEGARDAAAPTVAGAGSAPGATTAQAAGTGPTATGVAPADLELEIRAELSVDRPNHWMYFLCAPSFTFFPMMDELGIRHRFSVSDGNGEPLASEVAEARFTTFMGLGYLGANFLLNQLVRKPEAALSSADSQRDFTRDFAARLSQLAFDARMRLEIARGRTAK